MTPAAELVLMVTELALRLSQLSLQVQAVVKRAQAEGRDITDAEMEEIRAANRSLHEQVQAALDSS